VNDFQTAVEALNVKDADYAFELRLLVMRLIAAVAVLVGDYGYGEVPALMQLCHTVLVALGAESDEPEDRRRRYRRQQAVLNLLVLCCVVASFHTGSRTEQRKAENIDALKTAAADALQGLMSP
jgi:hypothetical protein